MPFAELNGIDLYFEEHGSPEGAPLVLVHGYSGVGAVWEPFLETFEKRYRLIVPDLRGHGRSGGNRETIHHRAFGMDLVALLDHLEIERAHFMGHSSGGMSLLFIGAERPERVLTLTLISATYTFRHSVAYMQQVVAELPDEVPDDFRQRHRHPGVEKRWRMLREAFYGFTVDPSELPFTPGDLGGIDVPTLILHGDRDPFFPVFIPVTMYEAMPRAELCILPNSGHDLPAEYSQLFVGIALGFLERWSAVEGTDGG